MQPGVIAGLTAGQAEALAGGGRCIFLEHWCRNGQIIAFDDNTVLQVGNTIAVSDSHEDLVAWTHWAQEVADQERLSISLESVDVLVTSKKANGQRPAFD